MKERSQVKHLDRKQQGDEKHTERWWWWWENKMKQTGCSNGCSLDVNSAFLTGRATAGDQPVLSSNTRLLDLSLSSTSIWLYSLVSWGDRVWIRGEKVNKIHTTPYVPHRHKCVCVRGQGIMFAFLPGVGTLPLPAESWGQARCAQWNPMNEHGEGREVEGGRGSWESRGLVHLSVVTLLRKLCSDLVKGESLPTSSLPWPWQWPFSQLSILSWGCLKATEY